MFHLRKDPLSTVEETEIFDATDTLIASCERVYRTRDAYITVNDKGRNGDISLYLKCYVGRNITLLFLKF